jgi:hypothetical protein
MAGMELLQFHTLLYSPLEEVSAEYDAPAGLPQEKSSHYLMVIGSGGGGPMDRR